MRAGLGALFIVLLGSSCAALEPLEKGACGNGVVEHELGEDCDLFAAAGGDRLNCPRVPEANACKYICTPDDDTFLCPIGWSCGPDGVCRYASGVLKIPRASPLLLPNDRIELIDADLDGELDLVSQLGGSVTVEFNDREGAFDSRSELSLDRTSGAPVFTAGNVLAATDLGLAMFRLAADRRFDPVFPSVALTAPVDAPVFSVRVADRVLYFWTEGTTTVGTFDVAVPPRMITDLPASSLLAFPSVNGEEVAFSFFGASRVPIVSSTTSRAVALPATITGGAIFADGALIVPLGASVAVAQPGASSAIVDASLSMLANDFPLAAGDLDGDGLADFVSPQCLYFADARIVCGGERARAVIGDFNADGVDDVASTDAGASFIEVRVRDATTRLDLLDSALGLQAGDVDGDGASDLIWFEDRSGGVFVAFGGAQELARTGSRQLAISGVTSFAVAPVIGDDSIDDLAINYRSDDGHRVAIAAGTARRRLLAPFAIEGARAVASGRFFDPSVLDAVVFADAGLYLFSEIDTEDFERSTPDFMPYNELSCFSTPPGIGAKAIAAKLDRNADALIVVEEKAGAVRLYVLQFGPSYDVPTRCTPEQLDAPIADVRGLRTGDLDQDGVLDLVIEAEPIVVLFGFAGATASALPPGGSPAYGASALNADSDRPLELAVLTENGVFIADVDEQRRLTLASAPLIEARGFGFGTIVAADLDHDGLSDLAYTDRELVHFRIFRPHNETEEEAR